MTVRWLFAALHLLALGMGLGAVWARGRGLQGELNETGLRCVFYADTWWGERPDTRAAPRLAWISFLQAGLVVLMVLLATAMARGYGL